MKAQEEAMLDFGSTTDLGEGVWHFRAKQWQTNCVVAFAGDDALVVDPAWTSAEVQRIYAAADSASGDTHLLLTHADCDHTCGIPAFRDAIVYAEPKSKELVDNGGARAQLESQGPDWGMDFDFDLRIDEVIEHGSTLEIGPFNVKTIEARGHIMDGTAFLLTEQRVLIPGDYLSSSMCALVWWSVKEFRRTTERLIEILETEPVRWVVPGHGFLMCPADAIAIGREDIRYLEELETAAASAKADGLSWGDSMVRMLETPVPRPSSLDIEIYAPHVLNARRALYEAGVFKPGEEPPEWG